MITRFRVEGENVYRDVLLDEMAVAVTRIIQILVEGGFQPQGEWECTDEVVSGNGQGYKGRMVMKFQKEPTPA